MKFKNIGQTLDYLSSIQTLDLDKDISSFVSGHCIDIQSKNGCSMAKVLSNLKKTKQKIIEVDHFLVFQHKLFDTNSYVVGLLTSSKLKPYIDQTDFCTDVAPLLCSIHIIHGMGTCDKCTYILVCTILYEFKRFDNDFSDTLLKSIDRYSYISSYIIEVLSNVPDIIVLYLKTYSETNYTEFMNIMAIIVHRNTINFDCLLKKVYNRTLKLDSKAYKKCFTATSPDSQSYIKKAVCINKKIHYGVTERDRHINEIYIYLGSCGYYTLDIYEHLAVRCCTNADKYLDVYALHSAIIPSGVLTPYETTLIHTLHRACIIKQISSLI